MRNVKQGKAEEAPLAMLVRSGAPVHRTVPRWITEGGKLQAVDGKIVRPTSTEGLDVEDGSIFKPGDMVLISGSELAVVVYRRGNRIHIQRHAGKNGVEIRVIGELPKWRGRKGTHAKAR